MLFRESDCYYALITTEYILKSVPLYNKCVANEEQIYELLYNQQLQTDFWN
jgi:hypothetical protein